MEMQTLDDLTVEEFEQVLDNFIQRDADEMPVSTFFPALDLIDREKKQQLIDIEGKIIQGELFLSLPKGTVAGIEVNGNELRIDKTRKIVIHLDASKSVLTKFQRKGAI